MAANPSIGFLEGVLGGSYATPSAAFEPQRMNSAVLRIWGAGLIAQGNDTLTLSIANFPLPKVQTNINAIAYLNEIRKFAGNTMQEDMNVSFHDYVDRKVANALWKWHYLIHDPTSGRKSPKTKYALTGYIQCTGPTDDGVGQTFEYDIYNIWPAALDMGDIDYNSDEPVRINVHFAVDKIVPKENGAAMTRPGGTLATQA